MPRRPIKSSSQEPGRPGPRGVRHAAPANDWPRSTGATARSKASLRGAESHLRSTSLSGIPRSSWYRAAAAAMMAPDAGWAATDADPVGRRRVVPVDELRRLYLDEGLPAKQVADRVGLTEKAVWGRLRRAGINRARTPQAVTDEKVRALYEDGLTIRGIAAELGIHQRSVWRHLDQAGVELRPRGKPGVVLSRRQLEQLYIDEGLTLAEIGRRFEVDPHTVARNLDRYGIARQRPTVERAVLEALYVQERFGIKASPLDSASVKARSGQDSPNTASRSGGRVAPAAAEAGRHRARSRCRR